MIQLSDDSAKQDSPRDCSRSSSESPQFSILAFRRTDELGEAISEATRHIDMRSTCLRHGRPGRAGDVETSPGRRVLPARCAATLATPPEYLAFREWFFGEIVRQLDGNPPIPWRDSGAS